MPVQAPTKSKLVASTATAMKHSATVADNTGSEVIDIKKLEHPMFLNYFKGLLLYYYTLLNGITQQAQWLIFGGNKVDAP